MIKDLLVTFAQTVIDDPNKVAIPKAGAGQPQIQLVLQIVFALAGIIAVIVIIVAGMQYTLSGGDPARAAKAKNAIIYAVVGLAVAILSFTIVSLTIGKVFG